MLLHHNPWRVVWVAMLSLIVGCGESDATGTGGDGGQAPGGTGGQGSGGVSGAGGQGPNSDPAFQEITLNPFNLCTNETGTLLAVATDADGDPIAYDWSVAEAPAGTDPDDYTIDTGEAQEAASFSTSAAGEYEIAVELSDGRGGTSTGTRTVVATNCGAPGSVHGTKWQDDNGNGERDGGEPGIGGVTIYMDLNGNAALDAGEPNARTLADDPNTALDESGFYWFEDLAPRDYIVREQVPADTIQTFPGPDDADGGNAFSVVTPGRIELDLDPGESRVLSISFTFDPFCFMPFDANVVAPSAPEGVFRRLSGIVSNGCGGDSSTFDIELTADGSPHAFDLVFINANTLGEISTLPVRFSVSIDGAHGILLPTGGVVEDVDFGNQPIMPGTASGSAWRDDDGDGQRNGGEPGLAGVIIFADLNDNSALDNGEPNTVTIADNPITAFDERGLYWLTVDPGSYTIREVVPENFSQTFPPGDAHLVEIGSGEILEGLDFGNQSTL